MIRFISPIREKAKDIINDEDYLKQVMARGAAKARESAQNDYGDGEKGYGAGLFLVKIFIFVYI